MIEKLYPGCMVGTILEWSKVEKLNEKWKICNGEVVKDMESPLLGVRLPILTSTKSESLFVIKIKR